MWAWESHWPASLPHWIQWLIELGLVLGIVRTLLWSHGFDVCSFDDTLCYMPAAHSLYEVMLHAGSTLTIWGYVTCRQHTHYMRLCYMPAAHSLYEAMLHAGSTLSIWGYVTCRQHTHYMRLCYMPAAHSLYEAMTLIANLCAAKIQYLCTWLFDKKRRALKHSLIRWQRWDEAMESCIVYCLEHCICRSFYVSLCCMQGVGQVCLIC